MAKETTWIEATANQATKIVLGLMVLGLLYLFEQASVAKQSAKETKIQWQKLSMIRDEYWKAKCKQAYINGLSEGRLRCLEKR